MHSHLIALHSNSLNACASPRGFLGCVFRLAIRTPLQGQFSPVNAPKQCEGLGVIFGCFGGAWRVRRFRESDRAGLGCEALPPELPHESFGEAVSASEIVSLTAHLFDTCCQLIQEHHGNAKGTSLLPHSAGPFGRFVQKIFEFGRVEGNGWASAPPNAKKRLKFVSRPIPSLGGMHCLE